MPFNGMPPGQMYIISRSRYKISEIFVTIRGSQSSPCMSIQTRMRKFLFALSLVAILFANAHAQQALKAFAQKDDTYLLFSDRGLDASKKYVLFSFWNPETPSADLHTTQFQMMKTMFAGVENVDFVNIKWESVEDAQAQLEKYAIDCTSEYGNLLRFKGSNFTLNASSPNTFFLIEENNAAFLCSGGMCASKIKEFFAPPPGH